MNIPEFEIDGGAIARADDAELLRIIRQSQPGTTLRRSTLDVLRVVAVELVAGSVPEEMDRAQACRKGLEILALLRNFA